MKKRNLLEKIKAQLHEIEIEIGKLDDEELAIFLLWKYIEEKSFSSQYFFGSKEVRQKIYQLSKQESCVKPNGEEISRKNLTCVNMSADYKYIAEELGLEVTIERMSHSQEASFHDYNDVRYLSQGEHVFCIVHLRNGSKLKIDPQKDIYKIQTKVFPQHIEFNYDKDTSLFFSRKNRIDKERDERNRIFLDLILRKIGYIGNDEKYTDEIIKDILMECENEQECKIIAQILSNKLIQDRVKDKKLSETYRFYRYIIKKIMKCRNTYIVPCYKQREDGTKQYSVVIYTSGLDFKKVWMYSRKNRIMQEIDFGCLDYFMENGLEFITDINGDGYIINKALMELSIDIKNNSNEENENEVLPFEDLSEEPEL